MFKLDKNESGIAMQAVAIKLRTAPDHPCETFAANEDPHRTCLSETQAPSENSILRRRMFGNLGTLTR